MVVQCVERASKSPWARYWMYEPKPDEQIPLWAYPFKQRICRLAFLLLTVFFTGSIVFAWQPFSNFLFGEKAFITRCSNDEIIFWEEAQLDDISVKYNPACDAQDRAIQTLYSLNLASELVLGTVAGVALDYVGPLLSSIIGLVFMLMALISLVTAANTGIDALYFFACLVLGAAADFIVFPVLVASDYFPNREGLILSVVVATQNLSSLATASLDLIYRHTSATASQILLSYTLALVFPSMIFYVLSIPFIRPQFNIHFEPIVPRKKLVLLTPNEEVHSKNDIDIRSQNCEINSECREIAIELSSAVLAKEESATEKIAGAADGVCAKKNAEKTLPLVTTTAEGMSSQPDAEFVFSEMRHMPPKKFAPPDEMGKNRSNLITNTKSSDQLTGHALSDLGTLEEGAICAVSTEILFAPTITNSNIMKGLPPELQGVVSSQLPSPGFKKELFSVESIVYSSFSLFTMVIFNYYMVIMRKVSGSSVASFNGYVQPTIAIWGLVYGIFVDRLGTVILCEVTAALGIIVYALALTEVVNPLHYIAAYVFIIGSGFVYTLKFTFIQEFFAAQNQGSLIAVQCLVSGIAMLVNLAFRLIPAEKALMILSIVASVACFPLCWILRVRKRRTQMKIAALLPAVSTA